MTKTMLDWLTFQTFRIEREERHRRLKNRDVTLKVVKEGFEIEHIRIQIIFFLIVELNCLGQT